LLTIDLHTGVENVRLVLDAEQRELMAGDGWAQFVEFAVPMYRNETEKRQDS
jgi:hypothetical protein